MLRYQCSTIVILRVNRKDGSKKFYDKSQYKSEEFDYFLEKHSFRSNGIDFK